MPFSLASWGPADLADAVLSLAVAVVLLLLAACLVMGWRYFLRVPDNYQSPQVRENERVVHPLDRWQA